MAHAALKAEVGPHGIPMSVATDPANAFKFVTELTTDFAAKKLKADEDAYYELHDRDKDRPLNRGGHLWAVRLNDK